MASPRCHGKVPTSLPLMARMAHAHSATLLERVLGWLEAHCRYLARSRPGLDPRDVRGDAIRYFLLKVEKGALDRVPPGAHEVWARSVLANGALHAVTTHDRFRRRSELAHAGSSDEGEDGPRTEDLTHTQEDDSPESLVLLRAVLRNRNRVADVARKIGSPVRRLVVIAVYFPASLMQADVLAAAQCRHGGARLPVRPAETAWRLIEAARSDLEADSEPWRRFLAGALCTTQEPRAIPESELAKGKNQIEAHLSRGRAELHSLLTKEGLTWDELT